MSALSHSVIMYSRLFVDNDFFINFLNNSNPIIFIQLGVARCKRQAQNTLGRSITRTLWATRNEIYGVYVPWQTCISWICTQCQGVVEGLWHPSGIQQTSRIPVGKYLFCLLFPIPVSLENWYFILVSEERV